MKFSCYKSDLTEALVLVIRAVAVKPMTPILAGIYLRAEGSSLELQGNNLTTGIITRIPVNVEESGAVVVSGKRLQEFVRNMPDDTITFTTEKNILKVESGGANVELLTMRAEDYPKVAMPETENYFKIRTTVFREMIKRTVFAVGKDDSRPVFTGVCIELRGEELRLVTTNASRLALIKEKLPESYGDCRFIVPANTLRGLMFRLEPQDVDNNYITVRYATRYATFEFDNVFINARLIEGEFPKNYEKVIPKTFSTRAEMDTKELRKAVDFVALISKDTEYNATRFNFADGGLEIISSNPQIGDATREIEAAIEGEEISIAFNVDYIAEVLKVLSTERVQIGLNGGERPALIREPENEQYIYIATPVHL